MKSKLLFILASAVAFSPAAFPASVALTWNDNSTNESGFLIERATGAGPFIEIKATAANVTAFDDFNVFPGSDYSYRARAFNAAGNSSFSNVATVSIPATGPLPAAPSALTLTIPGRIVNISDRGLVGVDAATKITGFAVTGGPVRVLIRAVGPTIGAAPFNVPGVLADPRITLKAATGLDILSNDNWSGADVASAAATAGAFALPVGSKDAALVVTLQPGTYTVHTSATPAGATGIVLLEVYEVPTP